MFDEQEEKEGMNGNECIHNVLFENSDIENYSNQLSVEATNTNAVHSPQHKHRHKHVAAAAAANKHATT